MEEKERSNKTSKARLKANCDILKFDNLKDILMHFIYNSDLLYRI